MRRAVKVLLIVLGVFVALSLCAYLARSTIATVAFARLIDRQEGVRCSHPNIEVRASLQKVVVGPVECSIAKGPIASAQTFTPTTLQLDGVTPTSVYTAAAAMNFRERDLSQVQQNTLADLGDLVGMSGKLIKGMLDAAETYSKDVPNISVKKLTQLRVGKKEGILHDYTTTMDGEWNRSQARKVEGGPKGLADVRDFDMRVTKSRGKLTMDIYLGQAKRGEKPDVELRLSGSDLDRPKPRFEMSLSSQDSDRKVPGPEGKADEIAKGERKQK